jgi:hypothetical protein
MGSGASVLQGGAGDWDTGLNPPLVGVAFGHRGKWYILEREWGALLVYEWDRPGQQWRLSTPNPPTAVAAGSGPG